MISTYSNISGEITVNVDISVGGPFQDDDEVVKKYIREKAQETMGDINNFLWFYKNREFYAKNLENFKEILGECYAESPNEYYRGEHCEPWYIFYTSRGPLKVGWRKRVINVDWSGFPVKKTADELFPDENVTKGQYNIHAWGYQDLKKFVGVLLNGKV